MMKTKKRILRRGYRLYSRNALRPEFAHDRNKVEDNQKLQAELNQARELIQQLKEIPHLAGHLGIDLA
jgi:hypothetical protein